MTLLMYKDGYVYADSLYTKDDTIESLHPSTRDSDSKVIPFKTPQVMSFDGISDGSIAPIEGEVFYGGWATGNIDVFKSLMVYIRWCNDNEGAFHFRKYITRLESAEVLSLMRADYCNTFTFISQHRLVIVKCDYDSNVGEFSYGAKVGSHYDNLLYSGSGVHFINSYFGLREGLVIDYLHPMDAMFMASLCTKSVGGPIHRWAFGMLNGRLGLRKVGTNTLPDPEGIRPELRLSVMEAAIRPVDENLVKPYHVPDAYCEDGKKIMREMEKALKAFHRNRTAKDKQIQQASEIRVREAREMMGLSNPFPPRNPEKPKGGDVSPEPKRGHKAVKTKATKEVVVKVGTTRRSSVRKKAVAEVKKVYKRALKSTTAAPVKKKSRPKKVAK